MEQLVTSLDEAKRLIYDLSKGKTRPAPPKLSVVVERDSSWVTEQLAPLEVNRLPLDATYWLTDKENFLNIIAWDWVDSYEYIYHKYDCENFAFEFFVHVTKYFGLNQVGIVIDYVSRHAYNLIIFPDEDPMILEPQNDGLIFTTEDRDTLAYYLWGQNVLL